ncbi:fam-a protein [Plasmodium chabaudi chabaudi]|uniref:Fam-a protein n=1 Tax=Plasmodium chabaudi chabaudi TaxID=31271 RepID=A0A1D3LD17_PLACU|nr:fam-a protein [Plasmodium chabaudi chabaudi]
MSKVYTPIVLFLLSIFAYANIEAVVTESAPEIDKKIRFKNSHITVSVYMNKKNPETEPDLREVESPTTPTHHSNSEEIYEKNKDRLCIDPEETREAVKLMNEAADHLVHHATSEDDYELCRTSEKSSVCLYKKKHKGDTDVERIYYVDKDQNKYDEMINEIWDPDHENFLNKGSVKIVRVYNPNLVLIQQRYKKKIGSRQKYFYALVAKVEISKDKTVIVMASPNINDHNPSSEEYKNKIIENANLLKIDIDSEDDIRKGKLKKTFVNLAGYLIEKKKTHVDVIYVESIEGHASIYQAPIVGKCFDYHSLRT